LSSSFLFDLERTQIRREKSARKRIQIKTNISQI